MESQSPNMTRRRVFIQRAKPLLHGSIRASRNRSPRRKAGQPCLGPRRASESVDGSLRVRWGRGGTSAQALERQDRSRGGAKAGAGLLETPSALAAAAPCGNLWVTGLKGGSKRQRRRARRGELRREIGVWCGLGWHRVYEWAVLSVNSSLVPGGAGGTNGCSRQRDVRDQPDRPKLSGGLQVLD